MSAAFLCYLLVAIAMCTMHLCLGIWVGCAVESRRQQSIVPKVDRAISKCHSQLSQTIALLKDARELGEACAADRTELPPRIVTSAEALAHSAASLHTGMESIDRLMTSLRRKGAKRVAARRTAAVPAGRAKANGTAGATAGSASTEKFRYEVWQYVAPLEAEAWPSPELFERVLCRDLSSSGFSFFCERLPSYQTLIVALGNPPELRFFVAQVTNSPAVSVHGKGGHLISCEFTRKLSGVYAWDNDPGGIALIPAGSEAVMVQNT